ncbi:MAG TPA: hypothetical protein VK469_09225 [Candidatus Kapabacteria bacterium]|nr:hypothetical protein [Candidatus Kapabacteria bacterium]
MGEIEITVINKLTTEKRDLNIYHHSNRSAYMISHNSSITLPLRTAGEGDYLHISIVSGPGNLGKDCLINMPSGVDFKFFSQGNLIATHDGDRTFLEIPPGPPVWQLKITRPNDAITVPAPDQVTIGDCEPGN